MRLVLAVLFLYLLNSNVFAQHKVAILDDGYNTTQNYDVPSSRIIEQRCISTIVHTPANAPDTLSLCKNKQRTDFSGNGSAEHPITYNFPSLNTFGGNVTLKGHVLKHTRNVSDALYQFTRTTPSTVNHQFFQVYSVFEAVDDDGDLEDTYRLGDDNRNISHALDHLAFNENTQLGAVSISIVLQSSGATEPPSCTFSVGQGAVNRLHELGIPVVVSFLNDKIPHNVKTWPQCLDKVIKVGSGTNTDDNLEIGVGDNGGVDFFAKSKINTTDGNSFAAPRIAGAYALLANADPYATVEAKTSALQGANTRMETYRTRVNGVTKTYTERYVQKTDMAEAIRLLDILNQDLDDDEAIAAGELDIQNNLEYGTYYGLADTPYSINVDFDEIRPVVSAAASEIETQAALSAPALNGRRDVRLSFTGIFDHVFGKTERFSLYINNSFVQQFTGFPDDQARNKSYIIHRKHFRAGNNEVELRTPSNTSPWGISNFKMEFLPSIDLQVGVRNTAEYGYEKTPNSRYTGIRANFSIPNTNLDYQFSMTGWDIDVADETRVYVNGTFVGHVTASAIGSSEYSPRDTFLMPRSILRTGRNNIELVQRDTDANWAGLQDEKWAVKDMEVQLAKPDLIIDTIENTTRPLIANEPFNIRTNVKNVGIGYASATTMNYYLSNDATITTSDTLLGSSGVGALNPSQVRTINKSLVTAEINKGKYVGACVVGVPSELSTANNCSSAVRLTNANIAPILMLLLLDE